MIDYAYGDDFLPYFKGLDSLVGKDGFDIRDEIRMVRPGLYLGRAYMNKIYVLNFILHNPEESKKPVTAETWPKDECWNAKITR